MEFGQNNLDTGQAGFRLDIDGDTAAVVIDFNRAVGVQNHLDMVACAGKRFVNGIIDDLPQAVHQALAVGRADIHARAFADRVESFKHGQTVSAVMFLCHNPHSSFAFSALEPKPCAARPHT